MASTLTLTYLALGKILQSNSNKLESLKLHVKNTYNLSESEFENVLPKLKAFYGNFKIKLNKHCRSYAKLFEDPWINGKIVISFKTGKELKRSESFGRPKKQFSECSARSKRRKVEELCATVSKDQITSAAIRNIKKPVGRLVKKLIESSGTEFSNLNKKLNRKDVIPLNGAEAVLLLIEAKLTKQQYLLVRHLSASKNANIFPSYQILLEAKKECYPDISSMNVSEEGASIKLQSLLKHTTKRLLQSISTDELLKIPSELVLHAKYGCDGASGQSTYNQSFTNNSLSDSHVFMISLVPLRLAPENNSKTKIWENVRSGSPRYCRPLKFIFAKESRELTQMEIAKIKAEISELNEDIFFVHGKKISVSYKLYLTMLDGKSCQHSNTPSSMTCYICGANPNDMNDIKTVSTFPVTRPFFEFGLSPLHAKIRFMEFILHLSYNLSFKNWKVSKKNGTDVQKAENKKKVQKEFKEKLGLNIDVVKQGCGTTNDGNMARKFFANPEIVASITSVDVNIIKRFDIILKTLSCGQDIDPDKFHTFAMETYELIVKKYEWYKMPCSVHKVLLHGSSIIKYHIFPIGQLTEEASEAKNKDYRNFREHHSRKLNRTVTNQDVLNMLLITSDPLLSDMRCMTNKNLNLPTEVKNLLLPNEFTNNEAGDEVVTIDD